MWNFLFVGCILGAGVASWMMGGYFSMRLKSRIIQIMLAIRITMPAASQGNAW